MVHWSGMREAIRRESAGALILRSLQHVVGRILWFERVAFFEADLAREPARLAAPAAGFEFDAATVNELALCDRAALESEFGISSQFLARCAERGHLALFGRHEGSVVAMTWLAFNSQEVGEIGRTMQLGPGDALSYNEVTLAAWRGQGIGPRLNQFADAVARAHGARRRITWRRRSNAPALRVADKLGHRQIGVATTVRVAGIAHALVFVPESAELPPLRAVKAPAT